MAEEASWKCLHCQAIVPAGAMFCWSCQRSIDSYARASATTSPAGGAGLEPLEATLHRYLPVAQPGVTHLWLPLELVERALRQLQLLRASTEHLKSVINGGER